MGIFYSIEATDEGVLFPFLVSLWDVEHAFMNLSLRLNEIGQCLISIIIILLLSKVLRIIFSATIKKSDRVKTVVTLLDGFVKYVLKACGVDTTALIASVGVLTLIIGLGAQSLIADIIAGLIYPLMVIIQIQCQKHHIYMY